MAVEPESVLRAGALEAAAEAPMPIRVLEGVADALPCDAEEFDAGVASLVLCSVPDQEDALRELFRVIKPGGELRFYEHVVAAKPRAARLQRMLDRTVWPLLAGGCHVARDTTAAIERTGFVIERTRRFLFRPAVVAAAAAPHVLGIARRP